MDIAYFPGESSFIGMRKHRSISGTAGSLNVIPKPDVSNITGKSNSVSHAGRVVRHVPEMGLCKYCGIFMVCSGFVVYNSAKMQMP